MPVLQDRWARRAVAAPAPFFFVLALAFARVVTLSMLGPRGSFTDMSGSTASSHSQQRQPSASPTSSRVLIGGQVLDSSPHRIGVARGGVGLSGPTRRSLRPGSVTCSWRLAGILGPYSWIRCSRSVATCSSSANGGAPGGAGSRTVGRRPGHPPPRSACPEPRAATAKKRFSPAQGRRGALLIAGRASW